MCRTIITNGTIVNDGEHFIGSITIKGEFIESVIKGKLPENIVYDTDRIIDASGKWILPGVIDDQVHFREPGFSYKETIRCSGRRRNHLIYGNAQYRSPNDDPRSP